MVLKNDVKQASPFQHTKCLLQPPIVRERAMEMCSVSYKQQKKCAQKYGSSSNSNKPNDAMNLSCLIPECKEFYTAFEFYRFHNIVIVDKEDF